MRWLRERFDPAVWSPAFSHGEICAESLILHEVRRRLVDLTNPAAALLVDIYQGADRIRCRHSLTRQDLGVTPRLFVALDISALSEAPTLIDVHRLTVNLANLFEANAITGDVDDGYATVADLLALERRILGSTIGGNRSLLEDVGAAANVNLVQAFEPGPQIVFTPPPSDRGAEVVVAIQQVIYTLHVDHESGRIANVVENGG